MRPGAERFYCFNWNSVYTGPVIHEATHDLGIDWHAVGSQRGTVPVSDDPPLIAVLVEFVRTTWVELIGPLVLLSGALVGAWLFPNPPAIPNIPSLAEAAIQLVYVTTLGVLVVGAAGVVLVLGITAASHLRAQWLNAKETASRRTEADRD
jgi:hypothetical protein